MLGLAFLFQHPSIVGKSMVYAAIIYHIFHNINILMIFIIFGMSRHNVSDLKIVKLSQ